MLTRYPTNRMSACLRQRRQMFPGCMLLTLGTVLLIACSGNMARGGPNAVPNDPNGAYDEVLEDEAWTLTEQEQLFIPLINAHRQAHNVQPVRALGSLSRGAREYSEAMVSQNFFGHDGPPSNPSTMQGRMCEAGYQPACDNTSYLGENVASGPSTAEGIFQQWRASRQHNANMLNPQYRYIGIGYALHPGPPPEGFWTNTFASANP